MPEATIINEEQLLSLVAAGDQSAFAQLYQQRHHQLGSYIFSILKSRELTQEIVQDVFLKVWMGRESLTEVRSFKDYLFIMSRNAAISMLKKLATQQQFQKEYGNIANQPSDDSGLKETGLSLIDEAVNQLPPRQQQCFILSRREKKTYSEIAAELGIGKETVKSHMEAAIAAISRYVKTEMDKVLLLLWLFINRN